MAKTEPTLNKNRIFKALGLSASKVRLEAGATARLKTFHLAGDPAAIESGLAALAAGLK